MLLVSRLLTVRATLVESFVSRYQSLPRCGFSFPAVPPCIATVIFAAPRSIHEYIGPSVSDPSIHRRPPAFFWVPPHHKVPFAGVAAISFARVSRPCVAHSRTMAGKSGSVVVSVVVVIIVSPGCGRWSRPPLFRLPRPLLLLLLLTRSSIVVFVPTKTAILDATIIVLIPSSCGVSGGVTLAVVVMEVVTKVIRVAVWTLSLIIETVVVPFSFVFSTKVSHYFKVEVINP